MQPRPRVKSPVPIIILWPFSPIRFVYELADTVPPIDRDNIGDPFAAKGEFNSAGALARLEKGLKAQKAFRIEIEPRRQGFDYAGSAVAQGHLPGTNSGAISVADGKGIGKFAMDNAASKGDAATKGIPVFRAIKAGDHNYHLHVVELHNTGPTTAFVALCSAVFGKPIQQQMVIPGSMSLGGNIVSVENLAESLQVAFDAGAKRLLLPMVNVKDIPTIPGELFAKFQTGFYADASDAVFKALGVG